MPWFIHFIPDECDSISVNIDNQHWTTWFRSDGEKTVILPISFRDGDIVKVGATVSPEGRNGKIEVLWDTIKVQGFDFDNYEDHDCHKPGPAPNPGREHGEGHGGMRGPGGGRINVAHMESALIERFPTSETEALLFSSGALSNRTTQPPEPGDAFLTSFPVRTDRGVQDIAASSVTKTFKDWQYDPWILQSKDDTDLAQIEFIRVALVRADDPAGAYVVYATLFFRQTSLGWMAHSDKPGLKIRILFFDSNNGLLEAWEVSQHHYVTCSDRGQFITFQKSLRPDWYDNAAIVLFVIDPSTWYHC